tara:strand:- start:359 stop:1729 length:1371 start_codon:yes stop_codon:yes gene_type:complete
MAGLQYAGEYQIKELLIHTSSGSILNLTKATQSIDIYEDMFKTALSGSITILDVDNVAENGPIIGQEYMTIKLTTPSLEEEELEFIFAITKVTAREGLDPNVQLLALTFVSPEILRDKRIRVSKSFTDPINKIIESILTDSRYINTNKNVYLEETAGIRKVVCPNLHPYEFIKNLTMEAVTAKNGSPYFFFFENLKGIQFKSLNRIFAEDSIGEFHTGDVVPLAGKTVDHENDFKRALEFQINSNNDMILNTLGGMLGSNTIKYNIYNKSFEKLRYNYFSDFDKFSGSRIDENPIYNNNEIDIFDNNIGSFGDSKIYLHPTNASGDSDTQHTNSTSSYSYVPNKLNEAILFRRAKVMEINNSINITMKVNGNTTIAAGQTIQLTVPITGRVHEKETDEYYSGRYLVTKVRHSFYQPDKKHEIILNASKDSLPKELPRNSKAVEPLGSAGVVENITY